MNKKIKVNYFKCLTCIFLCCFLTNRISTADTNGSNKLTSSSLQSGKQELNHLLDAIQQSNNGAVLQQKVLSDPAETVIQDVNSGLLRISSTRTSPELLESGQQLNLQRVLKANKEETSADGGAQSSNQYKKAEETKSDALQKGTVKRATKKKKGQRLQRVSQNIAKQRKSMEVRVPQKGIISRKGAIQNTVPYTGIPKKSRLKANQVLTNDTRIQQNTRRTRKRYRTKNAGASKTPSEQRGSI